VNPQLPSTAATADTPDTDLDLWLAQQTSKGLLRFLTCGSVDDGKSTLIGRLLYDSQLILDDQLASLRKESRNRMVGDEGIDFSLLVDGLAAEREQGITIDVAYRFFSTDKRKFIVADTPGHEQYTRNMATGASNADLAIVLIDARKGVLVQTRRHSFILSLIGVKHVVLAINKIDLVGYDPEVFNAIEAEYRAFAKDLGFETLVAIPVSALKGDNILVPSPSMPWYRGPQLVPYLDGASKDAETRGFPLMRALVLEHPDAPQAWKANDSYLLGPNLFVAPVIDEGASAREFLRVPPLSCGSTGGSASPRTARLCG
jgi:bifunctional enzyme CysN/CysC